MYGVISLLILKASVRSMEKLRESLTWQEKLWEKRFVSIFDEEMKAQIEGHWEMLTNEE